MEPYAGYLPARPLLVVLSGPSGAGKDTVISALRRLQPGIHYAVTATTRHLRSGEHDGVSYYFLDRARYDALLDRGELLAPAEVHGYWYGAPVGPIREAMEGGKDVLLKIDVQGAIQVRRRFPQATFVFLAPASFDDLRARLVARHTEAPAELQRRLHDAEFEMSQLPAYDYVVVNAPNAAERAAGDLACIIDAERLRIHRQPIEWPR